MNEFLSWEVYFGFDNFFSCHFGSLELTVAFYSAIKFNQNSVYHKAFPLQSFNYFPSSGFCPSYHISSSLLLILISEMGPLTEFNKVHITIKNHPTNTTAISKLSSSRESYNWRLRTEGWKADGIADVTISDIDVHHRV